MRGDLLGGTPRFVECGLCLLPRRAGTEDCPFCGGSNQSLEVENVPADFALRLVAEGRWEAAWEYLESEMAAGSETAEHALLLAWIAFINKDLRAVETWCHESLRLDNRNAGAHVILGLVLERATRWEEALAEYALALDRERAESRRRLILERKMCCQSQIPEW